MTSILAKLGLSKEAIARMTGERIEAPKPAKPRRPQKRYPHPPAWLRALVYDQPVGAKFTAESIAAEQVQRIKHVRSCLRWMAKRGEVAVESGSKGPARRLMARTEATHEWRARRPGKVLEHVVGLPPGTIIDWGTAPKRDRLKWRNAIVWCLENGLVEQRGHALQTATVYWRIEP